MTEKPSARTEQRKANLRLALILASVVAAFFVGFMVKIALLT